MAKIEQEFFLLAGAQCAEDKFFFANPIGLWEEMDGAWHGLKCIIGLLSNRKNHCEYGIWKIKLGESINNKKLICLLNYDGEKWLLRWRDKNFYETYKGLNVSISSIREIGPDRPWWS